MVQEKPRSVTNPLFTYLSKGFECTPDFVDLQKDLKIRHLIGLPLSFDYEELNNSKGENPLFGTQYHGVARTSSSCFTVRKDIFHLNSPTIFEVQGGRTDFGMLIPTGNLGYLELDVFSVPFRTLTHLDDEFCNTIGHQRTEVYVSMYDDSHKVKNLKVWIWRGEEAEVPEKYQNILNATEGKFYRANGRYGTKKVYT